ncbi:MAG: Mut7-C RNAse domain-containing protein [Thermodesulfobacteriota bacterium]
MKFIADRTLGKLVKKLRLLGFDAIYWAGGTSAEAARVAQSEGRWLLTRSHKILKEMTGIQVLVIEENDPRKQLKELISKLNLPLEMEKIFTRCLFCNEPLKPINKEEVEGKVPDFIYRLYDNFHSCPRCQRIYWPGTHWGKMKKELTQIFGEHDKIS